MSFEIQQNVSLAEYTTFKIGGNASYFVEARDESEVLKAITFAEENALDIFILGGGSNVLIADKGFNGLVLKIALKGVKVTTQNSETIFVIAGAGEDWDELVALSIRESLQGFECLSGIPGLIGGTPVQNVGAYGQEVSETIVSVRVFDRKTKEISELTNTQCGFAYRTSIFNTTKKNRFIVLAVTFALKLGSQPKIFYKDLKDYFRDKKPTLQETRAAVLKIRAEKSMVIDENDPNAKSAGSFFKNPIVLIDDFAQICQKFNGMIPSYAIDKNTVKVPAAWLIEHSGFHKGFTFGRAGLSTKHTLAIVNLGDATAKEILALKEEIQTKVKKRFNVVLEPEPNFVGF